MTNTCSSTLRKTLRQKRQALTPQQQNQHALAARDHLLKSSLLKNSRKIALFLSQDGELGTDALIQSLWQHEEFEVYLPALETLPDWHMGFSRYHSDTLLIPNQFKIPEPDIPLGQHLPGTEMDLVIMPLVGFDVEGNRMGMGGGYYDRTFEFKLSNKALRPKLVGWAHSCQQVEQLNAEPWDVPLDAIVTEKGIIEF
ncbi:5-formyltetrahydrofolate cyclo-ligase [Thiomicrorhabdus sp.]|uniref:5-formyltetrahydrofolate cyclo-ligase n=1 Tax=Thiomicrorhabdus sp. TaxID=2039724 RepID=UPI003569B130